MSEVPADAPPEPTPGRPAIGREYLEALLIAVLFALFARTFVVQAFKIPSGSMENNLLIGDHILVNKFVYGPASGLEEALLPLRPVRRGDVVVFKYPLDPGRDFIKRCIGLPGDTVELADKRLMVNGELIPEEDYVHFTDDTVYRSPLVHERYRLRDNFGPYTVPEGHFFCLGDNRDNSDDSRYWGPVPAHYVKGRAFLIYWSVQPPDGVEAVAADPPLTTRLWRLGERVRRFPSATRWERSLQVVR